MMRPRTVWLCCALSAIVAGCASPPTRIYGLDPVAPASRIDDFRAPALRVDALSVPAGWDRSEILKPSASGALEISDFEHWTAPLAQMARQTLSADLDRRLPPGSVVYPRLPKPSAALGVNVDILEFRIDGGSQVSMRASWLIGSPQDTEHGQRSAALLQTSVAAAAGVPAVVRAWSDLLGQLADRIAADAAAYSAL